MKASEKLYKKYAYLADSYAYKLRDSYKMSFDIDDVKQELRIRLYNSIKSYGKKWLAYKKTGKYKPIPLKYHLQTTMNNRIIDFMKQVDNYGKQFSSVPIQTTGESFLDVGFNVNFDSTMEFSEHTYIVAGIDLLEGLSKKEGLCFALFLQGRPISSKKEICLDKLFGHLFDATQLVENQLKKLRDNKELLAQFGKSNTFVVHKCLGN